jgi:hypothetical protein
MLMLVGGEGGCRVCRMSCVGLSLVSVDAWGLIVEQDGELHVTAVRMCMQVGHLMLTYVGFFECLRTCERCECSCRWAAGFMSGVLFVGWLFPCVPAHMGDVWRTCCEWCGCSCRWVVGGRGCKVLTLCMPSSSRRRGVAWCAAAAATAAAALTAHFCSDSRQQHGVPRVPRAALPLADVCGCSAGL